MDCHLNGKKWKNSLPSLWTFSVPQKKRQQLVTKCNSFSKVLLPYQNFTAPAMQLCAGVSVWSAVLKLALMLCIVYGWMVRGDDEREPRSQSHPGVHKSEIKSIYGRWSLFGMHHGGHHRAQEFCIQEARCCCRRSLSRALHPNTHGGSHFTQLTPCARRESVVEWWCLHFDTVGEREKERQAGAPAAENRRRELRCSRGGEPPPHIAAPRLASTLYTNTTC